MNEKAPAFGELRVVRPNSQEVYAKGGLAQSHQVVWNGEKWEDASAFYMRQQFNRVAKSPYENPYREASGLGYAPY